MTRIPMTKSRRVTILRWLKVAQREHQVPTEVIQQFVEGLNRREFPPEDAALILSIFGEGNARTTRAVVERYLNHKDPMLRHNALSALVFDWGLEDHRQTCIRMMHDDPDEDVRRLAVGCLGSLDRATHNPETLRLLLEIFFNGSENKYVRETAYDAILDVVGIPWKDRPSAAKEWNWDTDINWKLLNDLQQKLNFKQGRENRGRFFIS